jgi:hypothetical protein
MADLKISQLSGSTTPLAGTEVLPIVQSGTTKQVSVANLTAGRTVNATALGVGVTTPATGTTIEARNAAAGTAIRASNSGGGYIEIACESNATSNAQLNYTNQLTASGGNFVLSGANFVVGTSGKGIDFSATSGSGTSELLADYEEGTWTPAFTSTGATFTYDAATNGSYVKIGSLVTLSAYVNTTAITGTLTNAVKITGLPFASKTPYSASGVFGVDQFTTRPSMYINNSSTSIIDIYQAGTVSPMLAVSMTASGYYLFTITYQAA